MDAATVDSTTTPVVRPSMRYRSLDEWRGVACLAVVVFHSTLYAVRDRAFLESTGLGHMLLDWTRFGVHGVPLFFVISGYCITAAAESSYRSQLSAFQYFRRRFRRIFPPHWAAMLLVTTMLVVADLTGTGWIWTEQVRGGEALNIVADPLTLGAWHWFGNMVLIETWRWHIAGPATPAWVTGQEWTLCYEEQFYFIAGMLLLMTRRLRDFQWFFVGALGVSTLTVLVQLSPNILSNVTGTFADGGWLAFAMGILVFYEVNYARWFAGRRIIIPILLLCVTVAGLAYVGLTLISGPYALLLIILHRWDRAISSSALMRPLRYCGAMCYSLYLVHWPLAKAASHALYIAGITSVWGTLLVVLPAVLLTVFAVAIPFHIYIERRFLNRAIVPGDHLVSATLRPA